MREFRQYIGTDIRKDKPNIRLATETWKAASQRFEYSERIRKKEPAKYVVENAFESIREAIDAILFVRGYKSYSHEASLAYLVELAFTPQEVNTIDNLRRARNGIKYCGEDATDEEADKALTVTKRTLDKLKIIAKELKIDPS